MIALDSVKNYLSPNYAAKLIKGTTNNMRSSTIVSTTCEQITYAGGGSTSIVSTHLAAGLQFRDGGWGQMGAAHLFDIKK